MLLHNLSEVYEVAVRVRGWSATGSGASQAAEISIQFRSKLSQTDIAHSAVAFEGFLHRKYRADGALHAVIIELPLLKCNRVATTRALHINNPAAWRQVRRSNSINPNSIKIQTDVDSLMNSIG